MPFHNPFIKNGRITFPDNGNLVKHIERWAKVRGDRLAYRFVDFSVERDGVERDLNWAAFSVRNRAVAARLQQVTAPGDRVAILCPQNLEYLIAFFGTLYSGRIAVPLFDPSEPGHVGRLHAVLDNCHPTAILTTTESAEGVRKFFRSRPAKDRPRVIAVDAVPDVVGATWEPVDVDRETIAYLQYTSGSTRTPAGVEITHRSACTNVLQMIISVGLDPDVRSVSWLPLYHDMGLLMIMYPALFGAQITLMSPLAFVRRPHRWIKALADESVFGRTFAAAPNFAFELAAQRGLPKPGETLDLSNVAGLINGSEPVSLDSIERFTAAFAPYGLPRTAVKPSYGMAEATLFVSTIAPDASPTAVYLDRERLGAGEAVPVEPAASTAVAQVSCGRVACSQWAVIVDPAAEAELPDGTVGEIWLHGDNIGRGYWGRRRETDVTFHNKLQSRLEHGSHADGAPVGGFWLRTGDLGVYLDGELYITGRIKDLVIIDGRNHYPQDLEATAAEASTAVRHGFVAAFAVPDDAAREHLVIVAERAPGAGRADAEPIHDAIRRAISRRHGLPVADIRLVAAGAIPRTTSGKLARRACRADYLAGKY